MTRKKKNHQNQSPRTQVVSSMTMAVPPDSAPVNQSPLSSDSTDSEITSTSTPIASNISQPDLSKSTESSLHIGSDVSLIGVDMEIIDDNGKDNEESDPTGRPEDSTNNQSKVSDISTSPIDNNSLLLALQRQNDANFVNMNTMVSATISGAILQLKSELKSDFKSALDKHRQELVTLKRATTDQISNIDMKVSSNIGEVNTRINTLSDKLTNLEKVFKDSKVNKMGSILSDNETKTQELSTQNQSLDSRLKSCENKVSGLTEAITFLGNQLDDVKSLITKRETNLKLVNARCDIEEISQARLDSRVVNLESKSLSSDARHRKLNLVFEGIGELPGENAKGIITNIFNTTGGLANPTDIDVAYRLGKLYEGHTRPILVSFHTQEAKDLVLKNAPKIKQSSGYPNLWINRDHPDITRRQISNTRKCFNLMKQNNHKCTMQGTSITFGGRVYHYKDLNKLPPGSKLEDTRLIPCNDGQGICFQGDLAYLSNFYRAPFFYKDKPFTSVEQAFQWSKAISASFFQTAKKILSFENPFDIKEASFDVPTTEQWALSELDTLRSITYAKFSQNRAIGDRLRTSTYSNFYECTRNTYWGTGQSLPTSSREIDPSTFIGENQFGLILLEIREKLRNDAARANTSFSPGKSSAPQKSPPTKKSSATTTNTTTTTPPAHK